MLLGEPEQWARLMGTLVEVLSRYLLAQVEAGVDVVQLFDSWAGSLAPADYERSVLPYTRAIFARLEGTVPRIHFATGNPALLPLLADAAVEVVSVDWRQPRDAAWAAIGHERGIQGNLDPAVCLAPFPVVADRARDVAPRGQAGPITSSTWPRRIPSTGPTRRAARRVVHEEIARVAA